ncbi:hypothetical protein ACIOGX_24860 [Streptomyces sp. NPDC088147]|uniref:hypothetical protein n=1 Tax=Streptomyces sp. NPDC088147 TaxID=3365830 RepID=UPI0037FD6F32
MGPRLVFDTFDDIRGRCDITPVRLLGSEPGYDDDAIVPGDDWTPLTADEAEQHRADDSTPDSVRIELVRHPLPDLDPDDVAGRLETAARLDPLKGHRPPALLGCTASPANWATTTEDTATGRRIGLRGGRPPSASSVIAPAPARPVVNEGSPGRRGPTP